MALDFNNAIHIVSGASAAGSLKQAHHLSSEQILIGYDPLACGPMPSTSDIDEWQSIRDRYWAGINVEYAYVRNAENDLHSNLDRLDNDLPLVLWVATSLPEQLLAARVARLFSDLQIDPGKMWVVQVDFLYPKPKIVQLIRLMGELSPEKIRTQLPPPRSWSESEFGEYCAAWDAYTSDDPSSLKQLLARESSDSVLREAMRRLVYRYPSAKTGLCACDEEMLNQTFKQGPRAARVIGYTMGELMETEGFLGDGVLFHRLGKMSSETLASPLVSIQGDLRKMRECEVEITDFGKKVLGCEVNNLQVNTADDWVGGVQISGMWPVPHRQGDDLMIPN